MEKYISFSGGVESTTMCLLFGANATAIVADTGDEHEKMYERWVKVEDKIKEIHPTFKIVKVKHPKYTLPEYIEQQKFFPSPRARYCTRMFKIEVIDNYLKEKGEVELMIGLNAEEGSKRTGNHGLMENVKYTYPLFENGITRAACIALLKRFDLEPDFPPYMQRGGCKSCFFKSKKEFVAMLLLSPKEFEQVEKLEQKIQDKRGKFYGIRDGVPSMKKLREMVEKQKMLFEIEDIYDLSAQSIHTSCGVFCHR